jgi:hypothetical protein
VLPSHIALATKQLDLHSILLNQQIFLQAGELAVGKELFTAVDAFGRRRKHLHQNRRLVDDH